MNETSVHTPETEPQSREVASEPMNADWFLQNLVSMINNGTFGISISLHVAGFVVSGTLISGKQYFTELGAYVGNALSYSPEMAAVFQEYFAQPATLIYDQNEAQRPLGPPTFIHLKDARFFRSGSQTPFPEQGVLWRGKLVDVAGFFIGSMSIR